MTELEIKNSELTVITASYFYKSNFFPFFFFSPMCCNVVPWLGAFVTAGSCCQEGWSKQDPGFGMGALFPQMMLFLSLPSFHPPFCLAGLPFPHNQV